MEAELSADCASSPTDADVPADPDDVVDPHPTNRHDVVIRTTDNKPDITFLLITPSPSLLNSTHAMCDG
jgi:hypothetical protein